MTTYTPPPPVVVPPHQPPPPLPVPPPPVRTERGGLLLACLALILALAAAVFGGLVLARPVVPVAETVFVVPPAPPTFSPAEVAAAKQQACAAWNTAATATAHAAEVLAGAPGDWNNPIFQDAVGVEARTNLTQTAYLRGQVGPATPPEIAVPIHDYLVATFDQEDATMRRMNSQRNAAIDTLNAATDKVDAACGLK
jgi:hypothetical protein